MNRTRLLRSGATRCALLFYLTLFFVTYIAFVRAAPVQAPRSDDQRCARISVQMVHSSDDRSTRFEVHGLPQAVFDRLAPDDAASRRQSTLVVSVAPAAAEVPTPMLGTHRVENGMLVFEPRFPLSPGVTYLARLQGDGIDALARRFTIPKPRPAEPTTVQAIYPTSPELPENQLKFYVFFSAPMSRGHAYRNIRLVREDGQAVDGAFLEIAEELWDASGKRFTLLLDPGRVKRGLKPREEEGPVLEEGHRYTLVVEQAWPDAQGFELSVPARKTFRVLPPDDVPPDVATWRIVPPSTENEHTLHIEFPEPLDRALLERVLWIETADGRRIEGEVQIDRQETRWSFKPSQPWHADEAYVLAIERILEDRAGNRLGRKFEIDVFDRIDRQIQSETVRVPISLDDSTNP